MKVSWFCIPCKQRYLGPLVQHCFFKDVCVVDNLETEILYLIKAKGKHVFAHYERSRLPKLRSPLLQVAHDACSCHQALPCVSLWELELSELAYK